MNKAALRDELCAALETALAAARRAPAAAVEGATHAEARAENDKDTRGLEQSYLARGHAERVGLLEAGLAAVTTMALRRFAEDAAVAMSALVTVEDEDGAEVRYFVAPEGGGTELAGGAIQVVTPASPLGRALLGRSVDDEVELQVGARRRALTIVAIS